MELSRERYCRTYEGELNTSECALDLVAYFCWDVLGAHAGGAAGQRVRGSRVLEVGSCSSDAADESCVA